MGSIESAQDLVMRVQDVKRGFWSCCQAKPSKAVEFLDDAGQPVWYEACAECASTVEPSRVRELATLVEREAAEGRELAHEAEARVVTWTARDEWWARIVTLVLIGVMVGVVLGSIVWAALV
jgi:hypothetical protein